MKLKGICLLVMSARQAERTFKAKRRNPSKLVSTKQVQNDLEVRQWATQHITYCTCLPTEPQWSTPSSENTSNRSVLVSLFCLDKSVCFYTVDDAI